MIVVDSESEGLFLECCHLIKFGITDLRIHHNPTPSMEMCESSILKNAPHIRRKSLSARTMTSPDSWVITCCVWMRSASSSL